VIEISRLTYRGNSIFRLSIESLRISSGENVAVTGPSGSGKTTLLRLISGLEIPESGGIRIDGREMNTRQPVPPHQRGISLLSQSLGLWAHMTAAQHIAFARSAGKTLKVNETDRELLNLVRLEKKEDDRPCHLSGGEQQRLALARSLANHPRILLLDEPFSNLDPVLHHELSWILNSMQEKQKFTRVQVSHDIASVRNEADRIVIIGQGKMVQQGTWNDIEKHPADEWVEKLLRIK
jgi:ABC-type Fe3+/spermidine/putrescine transport system ATPase subunit